MTPSEDIYIHPLPQSPFNEYFKNVKRLSFKDKHMNTLEVQCQAVILFSKFKQHLYHFVLSR